MVDGKDAIRQTLGEVKAFLAQEAPPRLSEADTKAHFVEPLILALGWQGIGTVTREYYVRNSQEFIDYVLKGTSGPLVAIETKAVQVELADKHAAQLIQYCAVEGIEWAVLTNGRELQFFNTFLKGDLASKRVMRLDLLAFNSDEEYEAVFAQLWQLSRESMTAPTGLRTWMHQQRMDALVRRLLTAPDSSAIATLLDALGEAEIAATPQDLVQWFRVHLGGGQIALPQPKATTTEAGPNLLRATSGAVVEASRTRLPAPESGYEGGKLKRLVSAGLLPVGTTLLLESRGRVIMRAAVDASGRIVHEDQGYRSPSDRAFARALGRQSLNGWREWRAMLPDGTVPLDDLRRKLAADRGEEIA